jgi:4-diphosphocytidyl-2-C-methyl-D-erythritol kinase
MSSARVAAQAKINLRLRVLAREASGYHSIETVFHRVDLADDVTVRIPTDSTRSIDCRGADVGPAEKNLAFRAATAFADAAGWPTGFAIEIDKRIPIGGGMGGGSADAGAVLRALDALAPKPLGGPRLRDIAATLGADVPFLTTTDPMAVAWGRGERMIGLPALTPRDVIAVVPPFGISTADAYRWVDESASAARQEAWRKEPAQFGDWTAIERMAVNDFDAPVVARHALLGEMMAWLRDQGAMIAMLSGSGSTVIGVFPRTPSGIARDFAAEGGRLVATTTSARVNPVDVVS